MTIENNTTLSRCIDELNNLHSAYFSLSQLLNHQSESMELINPSSILYVINNQLKARLLELEDIE